MNWEDVIVEAAETDTGMRRANNQDSHAVVRAPNADVWRQRGHVFMVADGMGAHAVGELASKLACDYIPHSYTKTKGVGPAEALTKAYNEVGRQIYTKASANPDFKGMGTTCSTLVLLPAGALIAHVGDSRVYRVRGAKIEQLSFDHSLVWELVKRGHMTKEQAGRATPKNVITRSLGPEPTVQVDIEGPLPVEPGDVFVLCSDGLSGPVSDPEIGAFAANFRPADAAHFLTHLANLRGGHDNITTIVARVGPWTEPGAAGEADGAADARPKKAKGSLFSGLLGSLGRKPAAPAVEEHIYVEADCPIDERLIVTLGEDVRAAQAVAVEQAWQLDWPALAAVRRAAEAAAKAGDYRKTLQQLGEAISMLGKAGRVHRKETTQANSGRP